MAAFREIPAHTGAIRRLKRAILADRVSHAYLITGDSASGKDRVAAAFAQTLQCGSLRARLTETLSLEEVDACGTCRSCRQAADGNMPDLIVWSHEKPRSFSVEDVRNLVTDVQIRPFESDRKVYILPDAHLMTAEAQNALLKTLEEPPSYVVLLLLADSADAMLETIRSRCVLIDLETTDAVPPEELTQFALPLLARIKDMQLAGINAAVAELTARKQSAGALLDLFTVWYRDVLYYKASQDTDGLLLEDSAQDIIRAASASSYEGIQTVLEAIRTARLRLAANVNYEMTMELLLMAMSEN